MTDKEIESLVNRIALPIGRMVTRFIGADRSREDKDSIMSLLLARFIGAWSGALMDSGDNYLKWLYRFQGDISKELALNFPNQDNRIIIELRDRNASPENPNQDSPQENSD